MSALHYPRRNREDNVMLIKSRLFARTPEEDDAALEHIRRNFHPSLISELDQLEGVQGANKIAGFVDDTFLACVPEALAAHELPDSLSDSQLDAEMADWGRFWTQCLNPDAQIRQRLSSATTERLEAAIGRKRAGTARPVQRDHMAARVGATLRIAQIARQVEEVKAFREADEPMPRIDLNVLVAEAECALDNEVRRLLDYPPARIEGLRWLRACPGGRLAFGRFSGSERVRAAPLAFRAG
jgi:hypothetical protein